MRTTSKGLEYPNKYYWNKSVNPYGDITNGLADCTCFAYGAIIEDGHRPCTSRICNADSFHKYLINGWTYIPFDISKLEIGDIIEWSRKCHVAVVSDTQRNISGSFYTGMHGKAYWGGGFDTRSFTSLQEMSDWMITNYPTRFFHHWDIATENKWVGGDPDYILKHPLYSVAENRNVDQIQVLTNEQNVRNNDNEILCCAESGFYNVLSTKDSNGYTWYEVEKGKYIAGVKGRVVYIPKTDDDTDYKELCERLLKENKDLSERLDEIMKICQR